jgi:hypothetical protein
MITFLIIILIAILVKFILDLCCLEFKKTYYEQKFKNHKSKFTTEEWGHIQEMIDSKNIVQIIKNKL